MEETTIKDKVREHYAGAATRAGRSTGNSEPCCSNEGSQAVPLVDYGVLNNELPVGANLGLGCGLPTHRAAIQPGEIVLDLGSGAGVDVFLAAKAVGPQGKAIGVDMTPEMIALAWDNAVKGGYKNVDFRLGEIENLPVDSESVDVVLSNCVINLVPDKRRAFAEIFRVLKPGGRFSISDMVTYGEVPNSVRENAELWSCCVGGAMDREEYLQIIRDAGFSDVRISETVNFDTFKGESFGLASITVEARKE